MLDTIRDNIIKKGVELGLKDADIAYILDRSKKSIQIRRNQLDLKRKDIDELNKDQIIKDFKSGLGYKELEKIYGVSTRTIYNRVRELLSKNQIREILYNNNKRH